MRFKRREGELPINNDDAGADTRNRTRLGDDIAPKRQDQCEGRYLKGNQKSLIEAREGVSYIKRGSVWQSQKENRQKVPSNHESQRIIYPFTSQANKATTDGEGGSHFRETIVHHGQEDTLDGESNE